MGGCCGITQTVKALLSGHDHQSPRSVKKGEHASQQASDSQSNQVVPKNAPRPKVQDVPESKALLEAAAASKDEKEQHSQQQNCEDLVTSGDIGQTTQPAKKGPTANDVAFDLWNKAYDDLSESSKDLVQAYEQHLKKTLKDLGGDQKQIDAISNGSSEERMDALSGLVELSGKKRSEKAEKTADTVVKVLEIAGGFVSTALGPYPVAALAWSGVCSLTPVLLAPLLSRRDMLDGLEHVAKQIKWYMDLSRVCLRNSWKDQEAFQRLKDELIKELTKLYGELLKYELECVCAIACTLTAAAKDMLFRKKWTDKLESIQKSENILKSYLNQYALESVKHSLNMIEDEVRKLTIEMKTMRLVEEKLLQDSRERAAKLTIEKLNVCGYANAMNRVETRVEGTCEWIYEDKQFLDWLLLDTQTSAGTLLVLAADPGCGKSVLSKYLIDEGLIRAYKQRADIKTQRDITVCYFFFQKSHDELRSARNALSSIIHQLLVRHWNRDNILHGIKQLIEDCNNQKTDELEGLVNILRASFALAGSTDRPSTLLLVFDALDECVEEECFELTKAFQELSFSTPNCLVKLLVTTRPFPKIMRKLQEADEQLDVLRLADASRAHLIRYEIKLVMDKKVAELKSQGYDSDQRNAIRNALFAKVGVEQRTYLWVRLIFQSLATTERRRPIDLKTLINNPPAGIFELYDTLIGQIEDVDSQDVTTLLDLVLSARRPLKLDEADLAIRLRENPRASRKDVIAQLMGSSFHDWVLHTCGFFVTIYDNELFFIHQTANEYLLSSDSTNTKVPARDGVAIFRECTSERSAHATMAECCLVCIKLYPRLPFNFASSYRRQDTIEEELILFAERESFWIKSALKPIKFLIYASSFWIYHFYEAQRLEHDGRGFLTVDDRVRPEYKQIYDTLWLTNEPWDRIFLRRGVLLPSEIRREFKMYKNTARRSAYLEGLRGFDEEQLCETAGSVSMVYKWQENRNFLVLACLIGHCRLLHETQNTKGLMLDELVTPKDRFSGGPQSTFDREWRRRNRGVDRRIRGRYCSDDEDVTPLLMCLTLGHNALACRLLELGADPNARSSRGNTALHVAVNHANEDLSEDHKMITELLFRQASANVRGDLGRTPLHLALKLDNRDVIKKLLQEAATDVNIQDDLGNTPLHVVLMARKQGSKGRHDLVSELLRHHPSTNIRDCSGRTALVNTLLEDDHETSNMLLQTKPDLDGSLESAGDRTMLEKLLGLGARLEFGLTTMRHEALDLDALKFLLNLGVQDKPDREGLTFLHSPYHFQHLSSDRDVMKAIDLVLATSTYGIDHRDQRGQTPLMRACVDWRCMDMRPCVIKKLLLGADVNAQDASGKTALYHLAASLWWKRIPDNLGLKLRKLVQAFKDRGADLNIGDQDGKTPLHVACSILSPQMVAALLQNGANVNSTTNCMETPLHTLAPSAIWSSEFREVVGLLRGTDELKADVRNVDGQTALHVAIVARGMDGDVAQLLSTFIDANLEDSNGGTALAYAIVIKSSWGAVPALLKAGSDWELAMNVLIKNGALRFVDPTQIDHMQDGWCWDKIEEELGIVDWLGYKKWRSERASSEDQFLVFYSPWESEAETKWEREGSGEQLGLNSSES